jgi:hypothetical protein
MRTLRILFILFNTSQQLLNQLLASLLQLQPKSKKQIREYLNRLSSNEHDEFQMNEL